MTSIVIIWLTGLLVLVPILCALGVAAHRFDDEADDGLRRLMLRELARRRSDRRGDDRRQTELAVESDRRCSDRRVAARRQDRISVSLEPRVARPGGWELPGAFREAGVGY